MSISPHLQQAIEAKVSVRARLCFVALAGDPTLSVPQLALTLDCSESTVYRVLSELRNAHLLKLEIRTSAKVVALVRNESQGCESSRTSANEFSPVREAETVLPPSTPPPISAHETTTETVHEEAGNRSSSFETLDLDYVTPWFECYSKTLKGEDAAKITDLLRQANRVNVPISQADLLLVAERAKAAWLKTPDQYGKPHTGKPRGATWYLDQLGDLIGEKRTALEGKATPTIPAADDGIDRSHWIPAPPPERPVPDLATCAPGTPEFERLGKLTQQALLREWAVRNAANGPTDGARH